MKEFVLKYKKIVCLCLVALSVLFVVLSVSNLTDIKRDAYQAMYDANKALYDQYIELAEKFTRYGQSANARECYSKADELEYKVDKYKSEVDALNFQLGLYVVLAVGSLAGCIVLLKVKGNLQATVQPVLEYNVEE